MSQDTAVKLERLFINEVSGVDDPANESPGWMVAKANAPSYPIGPDQAWDVGAAEKSIREATGATDAPNAKYAACFLSKSGDGTKFGDYKFLVCDVVDGKVSVMPSAVRAAASRVAGSSLSDTEKASVQSKVDTLESQAGIGDAKKGAGEAASILRKIKQMVFPTTQGDEIDMTPEELATVLDERLTPVVQSVEELRKSVEAAPAPEAAPVTEVGAPAPDAPAPLTLEDVTKAVETVVAPYNEILEKVMDRLEGLEKASGVRKSLDGQESSSSGDESAPSTPTLGDAIVKAFREPSGGRPTPRAVAAA
jgi:hypothetical protein